MEEVQAQEELNINPQDVEDLVVEVIEETLLNVVYDDSFVGGWIDTICE